MAHYNQDDTIAAIATPIGTGGIGIVRLSGPQALSIADAIFICKSGKRPSIFKTYTTHYGFIVRRHAQKPDNAQRTAHSAQQDIIDEVILTVMRAPRSYTKEDIVEINCHGGIVALRRVLDLVLEKGCRLALPGEFTQRAFLNARIDLAQAEAVLDIIRAKTDAALKIGTEQLKGTLSKEINKIREEALNILTFIEANIDFPEEEVQAMDVGRMRVKMGHVNSKLKDILKTAGRGRILREGIRAVICGKPNVGKSSLLNALLMQERSIVTPVAGTTRDTIEEIIDIKGIPVRIVDTAGIIEPKDLVEKKAVQRSRKYIDLAELALLMFDGSRPLTKEDRLLVKKLKGKTTIAVINKIDLKPRINRKEIAKSFSQVVEISAKKLRNIKLLEEAIARLVYRGQVASGESCLVANRRHSEAVRKAQKCIEEGLKSLDNKLSLEFVAEDIKEALGWLDEILGRRFSEDLLEEIFSEFCIGK